VPLVFCAGISNCQDPRLIKYGTRIPVELVVAHLANNPDLDDLFATYPDLTIDDVKACLQYAQHAVAEKRTPPTHA
jgi:uncharacterized protein (DUF433 family)